MVFNDDFGFLLLLMWFPSVLWHCLLDVVCWYHVCKIKDKQTTWFSCSALTLQVEWQEGHPAHKNPVVVPVSLSFVRAPAYLGCKTACVCVLLSMWLQLQVSSELSSVSWCLFSVTCEFFCLSFRKVSWRVLRSTCKIRILLVVWLSGNRTLNLDFTTRCVKPGFHYPSSRAEFTGRADGPWTRVHFLTPELTGVKKCTLVDGPSWRPVNSGAFFDANTFWRLFILLLLHMCGQH